MPLVERYFTQVQSESERLRDAPKPFLQYSAHPAIVVLGDPGLGKTTTFQQAAAEEPNAVFVSVRDFLCLRVDQWEGNTLYLDGLDEQRAKTEDGRTALDRLRGKLDQLKSPRYRLSCRAADWYGGSEVKRLRMVSGDGNVLILRLEPLSDADIIRIAAEVLPSPAEFLTQAKQRDIDALLRNPQTLKLILKVVQNGVWPATRADLYQKACERLLEEINPEHVQGQGGHIPIHTLLNAAGYLCAVHLCGGTKGLGIYPQDADEGYPYFGEFHGDQNALASALRRRAFRSDGSGRVTPIHRTIAEFLAAHFIVHRFREGLPLKRILALLTGYDGGTLADLRGVYAWLACLCEAEAATLIGRDPLGIVLYGDAAKLSLSGRRLLLKSLRDLAKKNPGFRQENWSAEPFGALASSDIEPTLVKILQDPNEPPQFLGCILDAIEHGHPLPEIGNDLLGIVRDHTRPCEARQSALAAFFHVRPTDHQALRVLLDDIKDNRILDDDRQLRGTLLYALYPAIIRPHEIGHYLVEESEHHINAYTTFVTRDLVRLTDPQELPLILLEINAVSMAGNPDHHIWKSFFGRLIRQILIHHGEIAPAVQLYDWLGKVLDQYMDPLVDQEDTSAIQDWLRSHPEVVRKLFLHWISVTPYENPNLEYSDFWQRLHNVAPPEGFPCWLLQLAKTEPEWGRAEFLFREAVWEGMQPQRRDGPNLDELWDFTECNDRFRHVLENQLSWDIPPWRAQHASRKRERKRKREANLATRVQELLPQLDTIRSGRLSDALQFLAKLYFGLFTDVDRNLTPDARLVAETTEEIALAAQEGFIAALHAPDIPTPRMIGELEANGRKYEIGYPILAGMDLLTSQAMLDMSSLPESTLLSALAFHYANLTEGQHEWIKDLIESQPDLAAEALKGYWRPHLEQNSPNIPGLYDLADEKMESVARRISLDLLKDYPNTLEGNLEIMLHAAVPYASPAEMLALVRHVLTDHATLKDENKTLWFAAAYILNSNEFKDSLAQHIGAREDGAARLLSFVCGSRRINRDLHYPLSVNALASLIAITGHIFYPSDLDGDGWLGLLYSRGEAAISVRSLIYRLGKEFSIEATEVLVHLQDDLQLMEWRSYIASVLADQTRQRRELAFEYPSVDQIIQTLNQGRPANAADLQALISSHLHSLCAYLQDGPTDGWKGMWNVDRYAKPTAPRPENDCRDRLLEYLCPRLISVGVAAEPEGHYAEDKRADIKALTGSMNLPIEIKRHYHPDLWTAPREQLQKLYARDPGTAGRGIYVVLWFGIEKYRVPKTPAGIDPPKTSFALETALTQVLPESDRELIEIIVINCAMRKKGGKSSKVTVRLKKQR